MLASSPDKGIVFQLSPGQASDSTEGATVVACSSKRFRSTPYLVMDRAYEGDPMRNFASQSGFIPIVPPKSNRLFPWTYDRRLYNKRNEIERLFHRLKNFMRISTRFDKLDLVYSSFISLALVCIRLKYLC